MEIKCRDREVGLYIGAIVDFRQMSRVTISGLESLSSRGIRRFAFFDDIENASEWIHSWFITHHLDREALRGWLTTQVDKNMRNQR